MPGLAFRKKSSDMVGIIFGETGNGLLHTLPTISAHTGMKKYCIIFGLGMCYNLWKVISGGKVQQDILHALCM